MQEMFSLLNTCLDQLVCSVGCDQVKNSHKQSESRGPNNQTGLNRCVGDHDQTEDSHNLNKSGLLNDQTSANPSG